MNKEFQLCRTRKFAFSILRLVDKLPNEESVKIIGNQLLRSGTSIGANYRSACLAKSRKDFISKLEIVKEEADDTLYWIEMLDEINSVSSKELIPLNIEAGELLKMFVSVVKSAKRNANEK